MIKTIFICGLLLSAPLAIMSLKCYVTTTTGTSTLTDCGSSDEVCGIVKSKYLLKKGKLDSQRVQIPFSLVGYDT